MLVPDITQLIFDRLDFLSQVNLRLVSKKFATYPITNLFDNIIPNKYVLTDKILKSYRSITKLDAGSNKKITDVSHLTNLRILNACNLGINECGIDNNGLRCLRNLIELDAGHNSKITNVNHLINLRI